MQTRKNDSAMPYNHEQDDGSFIGEPGLTKREFFAVAALQGLLATSVSLGGKNVAELAVNAADLLILELNKQHGN